MAATRNYPLPRSEDVDPRFTFGLIVDISEVLEAGGYPKLTGNDLVGLRQALFTFMYVGEVSL